MGGEPGGGGARPTGVSQRVTIVLIFPSSVIDATTDAVLNHSY